MSKIIKKGIEYSEKYISNSAFVAEPNKPSFDADIAIAVNIGCKYLLDSIMLSYSDINLVNIHEIYYDPTDSEYKVKEVEHELDLNTDSDKIVNYYHITDVYKPIWKSTNYKVKGLIMKIKGITYHIQDDFNSLTDYSNNMEKPGTYKNQVNFSNTTQTWNINDKKVGLFNPHPAWFLDGFGTYPSFSHMAHDSSYIFDRFYDYKNGQIFTDLDTNYNNYTEKNFNLNFSGLDLFDLSITIQNTLPSGTSNKYYVNSKDNTFCKDAENILFNDTLKEYFKIDYIKVSKTVEIFNYFELYIKIIPRPDKCFLFRNLKYTKSNNTETTIEKYIPNFEIYFKRRLDLNQINDSYYYIGLKVTAADVLTRPQTNLNWNIYYYNNITNSVIYELIQSSSNSIRYPEELTVDFNFALTVLKVKLALYSNAHKFYLTGGEEPVDAVQEDNMNPVTSNAVWEALESGGADTFTGTHDEWNQKTTEEKKAYTVVNFTDDYDGMDADWQLAWSGNVTLPDTDGRINSALVSNLHISNAKEVALVLDTTNGDRTINTIIVPHIPGIVGTGSGVYTGQSGYSSCASFAVDFDNGTVKGNFVCTGWDFTNALRTIYFR